MLKIHLFSQINHKKVHMMAKLSQQVQGNAWKENLSLNLF